MCSEAWGKLWTLEGILFYENVDTGERTFERPQPWVEKEKYALALERRFTGDSSGDFSICSVSPIVNCRDYVCLYFASYLIPRLICCPLGMPLKLIQYVYEYVTPSERLRCECVCARWNEANNDSHFYKVCL
jgi:hypothetical protein